MILNRFFMLLITRWHPPPTSSSVRTSKAQHWPMRAGAQLCRYVFNCCLLSSARTHEPPTIPQRLPAAVVITFFVFWAPFHAQRLLFLYGQNWEHFKTVNEYLFLFGGSLYYVSWWVNLYLTILSDEQQLINRLHCCVGGGEHLSPCLVHTHSGK